MNERELYDFINKKGFSEAVECLNCNHCPLHPSHSPVKNACSGDYCRETLADFYLRFNNEENERKVLVALSDPSKERLVRVPKSYLPFIGFLEANEFLCYEVETEKEITEF